MSVTEFEKKLVEVLKQNQSRYLDETALLHEFGLSGVADPATEAGCDVQRAMELLRLQGYGIDGDEAQGWRLSVPPDMLNYLELENSLGTSFLGNCLFTYRMIKSTSETARRLAENGAPDGALLVAEEQTNGHGRYANSWFSPPGVGIWASLILRPGISQAQLGSLGMLAALSICLSVEEITGLAPRIKWPNDILLGGRKCAGILVEGGLQGAHLRYVVLGFGLNVNIREFPPELADKATSLSLAAGGRNFERAPLLRTFLDHLEQGYFKFLADGFASFLPRVQVRDFLKDRSVQIERPGAGIISGVARGIDQDGTLMVESGARMVRVDNGHLVAF